MLRIHQSGSWSVRIVKLVFSSEERKRATAHTAASHSLWVLDSLCSSSFSVQGQKPTRWLLPFPCFCKITHPIFLSQVSLSSAYRTLLFDSGNTGGLITASFNEETAALSFSSEGPTCFSSSFLNFLLRGTVRRAKLDTNRLKTLHRPRKRRSSVYVVGCLSFSTAAAVCHASSRWPG